MYKAKIDQENPVNNQGSCQVDLTKKKIYIQIVEQTDKELVLSYHY